MMVVFKTLSMTKRIWEDNNAPVDGKTNLQRQPAKRICDKQIC
eukprot:CAMPEP_0168200494 /NCGR_PEP_ID=MMETSP0139_2-20121125/23125_1 /TAXON_ID=44445 /ORGANISM="Pseudo-nitzschia australis, Strain 10249 10 AB" /LENGTH=42 /DNA_ID= /DNA_START= /DNA_END= /DNA_ORIENTATION=